MRTLVGIGNYTMGDDSVGLRVIEAIVERKLNQGFEAVELGDGGLDLLSYLTPEVEKMVWVDCIRAGLAPGEWVLFSPEEAESRKLLSSMTTHEGDMLQVLDLARATGVTLPPIRILGIQPEVVDFRLELSAPLQRRFDEYVRLAVETIRF